ncbi:hypothetical protein Ndes2526B_g03434 [Nannochloris sp. 'desiccata']
MSPCRQARTLRTCPVVMRKASQGSGGGREEQNLPATTERGGSGTSLGFPGLGLSSPFSSRFREMEQEMENMMRSFGVSLAPLADESSFLPRNAMSLAVDVEDAGNAYKIHADVPGMKKDEIKVEVSPNGVLTMTGERKSEKKEEGEGGFVRMERSYGSFARSFRLPEHVDPSGIKAEMKNGVLQLTVPKKEGEEAKKQTIQIDVGGE